MDYNELKKSLEEDYFIIRKGRWWSFLGGALAFVVLVGFVSYQSGIEALRGHAASEATERIENLVIQAQADYDALRKNQEDSKITLLEMNRQLDAMSTFEQYLAEIREAIVRGNPWVPFSKNIKDVVQDPSKYEYAILRNGGFRTLTSSSWNSGIRVMTSPHMVGDSTEFILGGSMWIWDTKDTRDDKGVYHLYYYHADGKIRATTSGNGLNKADAGGEGDIYRRLRK